MVFFLNSASISLAFILYEVHFLSIFPVVSFRKKFMILDWHRTFKFFLLGQAIWHIGDHLFINPGFVELAIVVIILQLHLVFHFRIIDKNRIFLSWNYFYVFYNFNVFVRLFKPD